ncbi:MAG: glycosyltransferase family 2 protein [Planctomycetes bacterium]|nr:glycosyltransferase family 2 protein [Planctomycetota bacterium]
MPESTLILIPACNEAERVGTVIRGILDVLPDADVVVIDDGSVDETANAARRHGASVLRHTFNLGYGAALQTGYHFAVRHRYERVVQMDADGQHDPRSLPDLLAGLDRGFDLVIGSRYLRDNPPPTSFLRRVASRMFAWIVTTWTGVRITDPTSGYQAMTGRVLAEVVRDSFPEDYPDADVLIALHRAGIRITEAPVDMHPRIGGVSMHRGSRVMYYAYKMALTLPLLPIRRSSPFREGRKATA